MAWPIIQIPLNKKVKQFKTPCPILVIGMLMMLAITILKQEMIIEMVSEMEMAEEDIEVAEVIVAEEIKTGKDPATGVMEDIEDLNVENEITGMNTTEEEEAGVVEAQEKEMIEEVVAKIDKALEVIEEVKTSEERKGLT